MDFVLVRVAVVLDERSRDRDVRPRLRNVERVVEEGARRLRVRLSDRIPAHDLEYEISALVGSVAVVDEITERRIDTKPPVRVAVGLVPYSIARRMRAVRRRIDENPGHCDASFVDDEPLRIVYVLPQAVAATGERVVAGDVELVGQRWARDREEERSDHVGQHEKSQHPQDPTPHAYFTFPERPRAKSRVAFQEWHTNDIHLRSADLCAWLHANVLLFTLRAGRGKGKPSVRRRECRRGRPA